MGWITEHAPHPDDLAACIQCGLCLPSCPTFRLTGMETASPRGRLTAMSAVADGRPVDRRFAEIMGSCLQCRACEVVCPAFVQFGKSMEGARAEVAAQLPGAGRRLRRLVTARLLRNRGAIRLATILAALAQTVRIENLAPRPVRGALTGLRRLRGRRRSVVGMTWPAIGNVRGVAALLAGCVMDQWFGDVHTATIELLTRSGYDVVVPPAQTCCGALAAHDGWADDARDMAAANVAALDGTDLVVVNAAGCSAHMKEYGHWAEGGAGLAAKVVDVTEVVADAIADGRLPRLEGNGENRGRTGSLPFAPCPADNQPAKGYPRGGRPPYRRGRPGRTVLRGGGYLQPAGARTVRTARRGQGGADSRHGFSTGVQCESRMRDPATYPPVQSGRPGAGRPSRGALLGNAATRSRRTRREMKVAGSSLATITFGQIR